LTAHFYPVIFDNSQYFFQLDKKRFYRWIDGVKQPVKAVRLTEEVITDK